MNVAVTCGASPIMADVVALIGELPQVESITLVDAEPIDFTHGCRTACVPYGRQPEYGEVMRSLCSREGISYIFVGSDEEAQALARTSWAGAISHLDTAERTALVCDKYRLHMMLGSDLVPAFENCTTSQQLQAMVERYGSVIERPVAGRGSKGLRHIVLDESDAFPNSVSVKCLTRAPGTFCTQFLTGDKFSADCIFGNGILLTCMIRNNGPAVKYRPPTMVARACADVGVFKFAGRVGETLGLNGFHQIECGKDDAGVVRLIEINPRLDATLPITRCYDKNFYGLLIDRAALGLMVPVRPLFRRFFLGQSK